MPICILERIYRQCLQLGLNPDDAHDCVAEVCLRYRKRTGTFPHDEETPDLRLLRLLTLNVVREHQRTQQRRQRLEQDYLALQRQQHASAPTPMAQAIARVDCEQFRAQLPDYLRRTLERMEAGDTPKAIAAQLGVAVGTVYSYQRELRERFVEFFGYDPRKSGVRVVIVVAPKRAAQTTHRRFRMMRRQKVLGVVALSLAVANLIALPDTLNAVAALRGGGQRWLPR
jgi:DNA-directed RNA polymerase specialized sigma24 family protein